MSKNQKEKLITNIYYGQTRSSKERNHAPQTYSRELLSEWLLNDWLFNLLYENWDNCGRLKDMRPSVDRLDDSKGYSIDNIQIITWRENYIKTSLLVRVGKVEHCTNPLKAVIQMTMDGKYIREFISIMEAKRQVGISNSGISYCCNNKRKHSGGFKWKFK